MGISQIGVPSGGVSVRRTAFTSSGSWTAPTGVSVAKVFLVGGGGGGGGVYNNNGYATSSGGGGGGQVLERFVNVTPGTTYTITIGAGGSAGTMFTTTMSLLSGSIGGDTTFGALATAYGGGGGQAGGAISSAGSEGRARYTGGGRGSYSSQSATYACAAGGGGAGRQFQDIRLETSTSNQFLAPTLPGAGGHAHVPSSSSLFGGEGGRSNSEYTREAVKSIWPSFFASSSAFSTDIYYGGMPGGAGLSNFSVGGNTAYTGKSMGGEGGATAIGFGGGGGGASFFYNTGYGNFNFPTGYTQSSHSFGSGAGRDGGGDGASTIWVGSAYNSNAIAGTANTGGGGGGGCAWYNSGSGAHGNSAAGGSGYCVVEWIE